MVYFTKSWQNILYFFYWSHSPTPGLCFTTRCSLAHFSQHIARISCVSSIGHIPPLLTFVLLSDLQWHMSPNILSEHLVFFYWTYSSSPDLCFISDAQWHLSPNILPEYLVFLLLDIFPHSWPLFYYPVFNDTCHPTYCQNILCFFYWTYSPTSDLCFTTWCSMAHFSQYITRIPRYIPYWRAGYWSRGWTKLSLATLRHVIRVKL